jgi:hypothetical protein
MSILEQKCLSSEQLIGIESASPFNYPASTSLGVRSELTILAEGRLG